MRTTRLYGNRRAGPFLFLFFACLPLLASCQDDYAFGLGEARFKKAVAEGDVAAIMALSPAALERSGKAGPEAFYYLARWLEAKAPAAPKAPAAAVEAKAAQPQNGNGEPGAGEPSGAAELPPALADVGALEESPTAGLEAAEPRERAIALYRLAMLRATGLAKTSGGEAFLARRAARAAAEKTQASWEALLAATEEYERVLGPGWTASGRRLEALDALGRDAEILREIEGLRVGFPAEAEANADALLYFEGAASRRLGRRVWSPPLAALLLERPTSEWTERALAFVQTLDPPPAEFPAATLAAARMRIEVRRRDYGAAYRAAARCLPLVVSPQASKQLLADAGKAFLYSGSSAEGLKRFAAAFEAGATAAAPPRPEVAWTADFYRARFLKALQRWDEAASAFLRLALEAPSPEEGDAARWYAAESRGKAAEAAAAKAASAKSLAKLSTAAREKLARQREAETRRLRLAGLLEVAASWRDPARFSDLADALLRDAIGARDWDLVAEFARGLGARLTPTLDARANYVAGRTEELGLRKKPRPTAPAIRGIRPSISDHEAEGKFPAETDNGPAANYRAILARPGVSPYYRILAAHRLGERALSLPAAPPPGAGSGVLGGATGASGGAGSSAAGSGSETAGALGAPGSPVRPAEAFVQGFFEFGLGASAFAEAKTLVPELDQDALRRLSTRFAEAGLHADSMRLALLLSERPDWEQRREDYERIYPRPFLEELRSIRPKAKVPEHVLFGLIRSESFFRPDVASHAGAIGLSQLMPATAAEQARKMGLGSYDLRVPKDNLRIGADHFEDLLTETGNHPLRAMWAYNAGRGRLKRWLAESPDLPDDLLLEALGIEETRQYGRNILQAATMYAELYYGIDAADAVDEMLGEQAR